MNIYIYIYLLASTNFYINFEHKIGCGEGSIVEVFCSSSSRPNPALQP